MTAKLTAEGTPRVLLVDDEEGFRTIMQKRMGRRNIDVTTAASGSEAVAILRKHDFDAAVVDFKMEDMDGIEVLKIFKKMVPSLPVIILTGHGSGAAAREGIKQGAFDYLTKPCDLENLMEKIREAMQEGS
jgi:DNA-binding NtrC family response regulator